MIITQSGSESAEIIVAQNSNILRKDRAMTENRSPQKPAAEKPKSAPEKNPAAEKKTGQLEREQKATTAADGKNPISTP